MRPASQDRYDSGPVGRLYDDKAADYAVQFGAELRQPGPETEFLDAALADLPGGPVLDLGCGPAQVSGYLLGRGRAAIGIDLAPRMLAAAARLVPGARLIAADLMELPLRPASCAGAVASYSLHHLPKVHLPKVLGGLREALKPDGVLVIVTHGGTGEDRLTQYDGKVFVSRYEPDELASLLSGCGFKPELTSSRPPRPGEFPAAKVRISARA